MGEILDKKDQIILEALKEDASRSSQQIAKLTGIPITTVHNRVRRLRQRGIIKQYTIHLDNRKLGKNVSVYVLIKANYAFLKGGKMDHDALANKIHKYPGVESVSLTTGGIDILVKAVMRDMDELNAFVGKFLRALEGVERTETLVVLTEH
ncbi:Lrp/AsnC family transcriptional regulator [Candidatus Woesearchaeota archaeon]|nr:Lrp/AsnC family transcriptional regulator [Candidatus Woesearchaeota archaeon]